MKLKAYSIFDRKSLIYHPPFFFPTDGAAVRVVSDEVGNANSQIGRHPTDFVLFHVGEYDDQKGELTPIVPLVHIIDAVALVQHQGKMFVEKEDA